MEFHLIPQFNFDLGMNTNPSLGFVEDDDDEFYAEMRKRIMILTGDQNDDFPETKIIKPSHSSVNKPKSLSSSSSQDKMSLWEYECSTTKSEAVPDEHAKPCGISAGTGVFIPQSTGKYYRRNFKPKPRGRRTDRKVYNQMETKHCS